MARRSDHTRDQLKDLILSAAWKIVGEQGPEALTARAVAAEISYTPGTVYNVFEDMNDLIIQTNLRTIGMLQEALNSPECQNPSHSPAQNAKTMGRLYYRFAEEHRPYWLLLYTHTLPADRFKETGYKDMVDQLFAPLERILSPIYPSQGSEHEIKTAARALWASVHGICYLQETQKLLLLQDETNAFEATDYLIDTFFAGLEV